MDATQASPVTQTPPVTSKLADFIVNWDRKNTPSVEFAQAAVTLLDWMGLRCHPAPLPSRAN